MKLLIINGNPDDSSKDFEAYLSLLEKKLRSEENTVDIINLRNQRIDHCTGCRDCWVKTPGQCAFDDDSIAIRDEYAKADIVIFASPIRMGFVSPLLKNMMDKLVPLLHPYVEIAGTVTSYSKRLEKYPLIGLIYENLSRDPEDIQITNDIFRHFALNYKSVLIFSFSTNTEISNVIDEIDSY